MTVLDVLQSTTAYFKKRGIENPRLNAEHLLAHSLGRKRLDVYLEFERDLAEPELAPLRELVRRRGQNEPLQHLLGTVEFCGNAFLCDDRALVPRPETEELVEFLDPEIRGQPPAHRGLRPGGKSEVRIIDVGTGSGVIALSLAQKFPEAEIIATDISDDALLLARENAVRLGIAQVQFLQSDLLENVDGKFDLIVANLPYISRYDRDQLAPEVLRDPEVALFAGEKGDEIIRRLIESAPLHLNAGGLLALEIGLGQEAALIDLLREKNYRDIEAKNDYSGRTRFLFARYG
jgi:release factor glutamine methyltransferase